MGVAIIVDHARVYKLLDTVETPGPRTVRNDGSGSAVVGTDPQLSASGAGTVTIAANSEERLFLEAGQSVYAQAPSGQTASLDVF